MTGKPLLQIDAVEKRFGGLAAVGGVSFDVDEGQIVALVGPNGAGKSTLLKLIGGMEQPSAGSIRFAGRELGRLKPHQARHAGVAIVLQTPRPFETMTVRENAALGALFGGARGSKVRGSKVQVSEAEALRLGDELLEFVGLEDRRGESVGSLNLHEQRFLEIARQLAGRPRLVLLDEVMAGLNDTELDHSVDLVHRARERFGVTVIWVEHVMKAVMSLAERVLVLDFGRLIADGSPAAVMRQDDVIEAYLGQRAEAG